MVRRLATVMGAAALVILMMPAPAQASGGRPNNSSPCLGGAVIGDCTTGFSFFRGATSYMLTAGHCLPDGGPMGTDVDNLGYAVRDNWETGSAPIVPCPASATSR